MGSSAFQSEPDSQNSRLKAIELLDFQNLPQTFDNFTFPTAEIQTLVHWLKDNREKVETLHVVLLPSEDVKSKLTAHAARIYLNKVVLLAENVLNFLVATRTL